MSETLIFKNIFKIAVISLRINGSYPSITRNKIWYMHVTFVFSVNLCCFYLLGYSILMHDIKSGNFTEACKNICMIIICMNTSIKFIVLIYNNNSIMDLIHVINDDYRLAKQFLPEELTIVKQYARKSRYVSIFWLISASTGGVIFLLKSIILTAYSFWVGENNLIPMFDMTFPTIIEKHKDSLSVYFGILALCVVFAFFSAIMYIGFDPLIPILTLHVCGQLDLLSNRISTALSNAKSLEEKKENLKNIIKKLQELYKFVNCLQSNFLFLNEFNMKTTTIILPILEFHITEDIRNNVINVEFIILLVGAVVHFLIPCYFSDLLMERSARLRQAIYSCGWEKHPDSCIRSTVLFMFTRALRPLSISTVFYNISLETFSTMINQSYGLFNLMNAAWRN